MSQALVDAIQTKNINEVKRLLSTGLHPDTDPNLFPLHEAIEFYKQYFNI
jgi:hypothetical protein